MIQRFINWGKFKTFLALWIIPPGLLTLRRTFIHQWRGRDSLDTRRYWNGALVPATAANLDGISYKQSDVAGITLNQETRDCIFVPASQQVEIELQKFETGSFRFGFGWAAGRLNTTLEGSVSVHSGGHRIAWLSHLLAGKWCDTCVSSSAIFDRVTVANDTLEGVWISCPVAQPAAGDAEINNVIVVVLDSMMTQSIGARSPGKVPVTPFIDAFFDGAHSYRNCFSISEWTFPSVYSILSSTYPITHGYTDMRNSAPSDWAGRRFALAEILQKRGYSTMACSTAKVFTPAFGAHAGFDRFFYDSYPESGRTSTTIAMRAVEHLEANREGKNFLFLHIIDTHEPWIAPSFSENCSLPTERIVDPMREYLSLQLGVGDSKAEPIFGHDGIEVLKQRHDVRLRNVDLHLQSLFGYLESTGLTKKSLVVLTGDHGCAYLRGSEPLLTDSRLRVPLLIRHPKQPGRQFDGLVNLGLDLGPTLLSMVGARMETEVGKVIFPFGSGEERRFVICESVFQDKYKVALRTRTHTLHLTCRYEIHSKTIRFDQRLSCGLYNNETEQLLDLERPEYASMGESMMDEVRKHLVQHSKAFQVVLGGE